MHFATIIDQVISRIKVIFEDTTVRLDSEAELATGLEVRIDRMEFVDEMLEASEAQKQDGPITAQPTSLYTVTDLNKLLHVEGIRMYTDIYSSLVRELGVQEWFFARLATLLDRLQPDGPVLGLNGSQRGWGDVAGRQRFPVLLLAVQRLHAVQEGGFERAQLVDVSSNIGWEVMDFK